MWPVIAALNSKVSIYLLESKFLFKEDFFNYKKVREVDVVIIEKALEWKDYQDFLFNPKIRFTVLINRDVVV